MLFLVNYLIRLKFQPKDTQINTQKMLNKRMKNNYTLNLQNIFFIYTKLQTLQMKKKMIDAEVELALDYTCSM